MNRTSAFVIGIMVVSGAVVLVFLQDINAFAISMIMSFVLGILFAGVEIIK